MNNSEVIEAPRSERRDVTPPPVQTALAAVGMSPCPNLSAAVALARDRCKAAIKRSYNTYHKFSYASADEVIATANDALEGSGLSILPLDEDLVVAGTGNSMYFALNRLLVLSHTSGEFVVMKTRGWPVIPEKGRPLDKAFAIALTSSYAYKLRDLLQMPREDPTDDMTARDDRATPVQAQPPVPNPTQAPPIPTEQVDRLSAMVNELGLSWPAVGARLESAYGVKSLALLTPAQAGEVESGLRKALASKQPAPVASASSAGS